jgi:hypothetical protein
VTYLVLTDGDAGGLTSPCAAESYVDRHHGRCRTEGQGVAGARQKTEHRDDLAELMRERIAPTMSWSVFGFGGAPSNRSSECIESGAHAEGLQLRTLALGPLD